MKRSIDIRTRLLCSCILAAIMTSCQPSSHITGGPRRTKKPLELSRVELYLQFEGCIRPTTLWELMVSKKISIPDITTTSKGRLPLKIFLKGRGKKLGKWKMKNNKYFRYDYLSETCCGCNILSSPAGYEESVWYIATCGFWLDSFL